MPPDCFDNGATQGATIYTATDENGDPIQIPVSFETHYQYRGDELKRYNRWLYKALIRVIPKKKRRKRDEEGDSLTVQQIFISPTHYFTVILRLWCPSIQLLSLLVPALPNILDHYQSLLIQKRDGKKGGPICKVLSHYF